MSCSWLLIGVVVLVDCVPQILPLIRQENVVPRTIVIDPSVVLVSGDQNRNIFFKLLMDYESFFLRRIIPIKIFPVGIILEEIVIGLVKVRQTNIRKPRR